jgi:hypothetical protein
MQPSLPFDISGERLALSELLLPSNFFQGTLLFTVSQPQTGTVVVQPSLPLDISADFIETAIALISPLFGSVPFVFSISPTQTVEFRPSLSLIPASSFTLRNTFDSLPLPRSASDYDQANSGAATISAGVLVPIVVVSVLALIGIAAGLFLYIRRRKQALRPAKDATPPPVYIDHQPTEMETENPLASSTELSGSIEFDEFEESHDEGLPPFRSAP